MFVELIVMLGLPVWLCVEEVLRYRDHQGRLTAPRRGRIIPSLFRLWSVP